ncbi:MAG: hypothetical protein NTY65_02530 [Planctomycetota bacterium]|nr:hypothetical protein [Planctomycetota bacterium]
MDEGPTTITTAELPRQVHDDLVAGLRAFFPDAQEDQCLQFSQGPPAWVEIIAGLTSWTTILKIAAGAYVARLAARLADEHWDNRAKYRKEVINALGIGLDVLRKFVGLLAKAKNAIGRELGVRLGIPGPGHSFTCASLSSESDEELLEETALFVHYLDGIAKAIRVISQQPHGTAGNVWCRFLRDGFCLLWQDRNLGQFHQFFGTEGTPRTEILTGWPKR